MLSPGRLVRLIKKTPWKVMAKFLFIFLAFNHF